MYATGNRDTARRHSKRQHLMIAHLRHQPQKLTESCSWRFTVEVIGNGMHSMVSYHVEWLFIVIFYEEVYRKDRDDYLSMV